MTSRDGSAGVPHGNPERSYAGLFGVGGIGTGMFFALEGDHTLGRNESRPARRLDVRDYCKLHIIAHYVSVLLGAGPEPGSFHVLPIGKVGDDAPGRAMIQEMTCAGMDVSRVSKVMDRPTTFSVCFQYPDGSGGNITTSAAAAEALTDADIDAALPLPGGAGARYIALAAPEVPVEARLHLLRRATALGAFRVACLTSADAISGEWRELLRVADLVALNEDEAGALAGQAFPNGEVQPFLDRCAAVLGACQAGIQILLSAGARGAFAYDGRAWEHRPAMAVVVVSTAGAGDALLAGVLCGLVAGAPLISVGNGPARAEDGPLGSALDLGVLVASLSVTSPHTIHPDASLESLRALAGRLHLSFSGELARFAGARAEDASG